MTVAWRNWGEKIFPLGIPLAWLQLVSERKRFVTAVAGITVAVTLMLFQLGLYDALFKTVVRPHEAMNGEVFVISKTYSALVESGRFTRRRLYQTLADDAVISASSIYIGQALWKNPLTRQRRDIFILGCRPGEDAFRFSSVQNTPAILQTPDAAFFDTDSRAEYGPVVSLFEKSGLVQTELDDTTLKVKGLFGMGPTFAADGNLLMGDLAFFRYVPYFPREMASVGLIRLKPGSDPAAVAQRLEKTLPSDVRVVTRKEFLDIDRTYWARRTPIGFVISASMIVGMLVGGVIIYQILYTDVSDHLHEYATLKGIGFSDRFFLCLILQQSLILTLTGFLPGIILSFGLFRLTWFITHLPTVLSFWNLLIVFVVTCIMCSVGGALAARKLRSVNPAELF